MSTHNIFTPGVCMLCVCARMFWRNRVPIIAYYCFVTGTATIIPSTNHTYTCGQNCVYVSLLLFELALGCVCFQNAKITNTVQLAIQKLEKQNRNMQNINITSMESFSIKLFNS